MRPFIFVSAVIATVIALVSFTVGKHLETIDHTNEQVVAVAEDLGCTVIEQSDHHPENYYIDCGNDEIRIIKVEK